MGEKAPTVGLAGVCVLFYFLGTVIAVNAAPENATGDLKDNLAIGAGSIMIILGLLSAVATAALSQMAGIDTDPVVAIAAPEVHVGTAPEEKTTGDVEAPPPPPPAAEAPAAEEAPAQ